MYLYIYKHIQHEIQFFALCTKSSHGLHCAFYCVILEKRTKCDKGTMGCVPFKFESPVLSLCEFL